MEQLNSSAYNIYNTTSPLERLSGVDLAYNTILSICILVGVPGNLAVMVFLRQNNQLSTLSCSLMLNLAVSDLLCILTLPLFIYNRLHSWDIGLAVCKINGFLLFCSVASSLLNVTMLSVQRYLQVALPQRISRLGLAGQRVLLVVIWGCAACIASPYLMLFNFGEKKACVIRLSSDSQHMSLLLAEVIVGFVVPFSVMTSAYICLHRRATQSVFFNSPRMNRLIISIIVTFIVFWTPLQLVNMLGVAGILLRDKSLREFHMNSQALLGALTVVNSVMNPFLYAFASKKTKETSNTLLMTPT